MERYFSQTSIINYIGAGLWVAVPVVILLLVMWTLARKSRLGTIVVGILLLVGSLPAAFMSEISINGCCGAPSAGHEGLGYVIGGVLAVMGMGIIIFGKKLVKQN